LVGQGLTQATSSGWLWLTPISQQTASYSAPIIGMAVFITMGLGLWVFGRGSKRVRRCDPWDCGFSGITPAMQYTASAFSQPIRRIFSLLFRIEESLEVTGKDIPRYSLHVFDRLWTMLYLPIARAVDKSAALVTRMQSGHIRLYLGWSLLTLLILLWMIA
jgi:hypothetical protein